MPYLIKNNCTNCGLCESVCPSSAIYSKGSEWLYGESTDGDSKKIVDLFSGEVIETDELQAPLDYLYHFIVPEKCNDCAGQTESLCAKICPEDSCIIDEDLTKPGDRHWLDDKKIQEEEVNEIIKEDTPIVVTTENIKKLLTEGFEGTTKALKLLLNHFSDLPSEYNEVIILSSEWNEFKKENRAGAISKDERSIKVNAINKRILDFIDSTLTDKVR